MIILVGICSDSLIGAHRRGNWEFPRMGEGVGGQVDEGLSQKHHRTSRSVAISVEIFRMTFPACIGDF